VKAVLLLVAWFVAGVLSGIVITERYAPENPQFFCRPSDRTDACEPYPWPRQ